MELALLLASSYQQIKKILKSTKPYADLASETLLEREGQLFYCIIPFNFF